MSTLLQPAAPTCPLVVEPEVHTAPIWNAVCHINYTRDTWVNLLQLPSRYAYEKAKLLCPASDSSWAAWVPNHGEVILDRSHFYC